MRLEDYVDEEIVGKAILNDKNLLVGRTRHYAPNLLPRPSFIALMKFKEKPHVYILYFNEYGEAQTDTMHDDLPNALSHAKFEFEIEVDQWEKLIPAYWEGITGISD